MRERVTPKIWVSIIWLLTCGLFLGGIASAEEDVYPNPIDEEDVFYYCSSNPTGGEYNVYPCTGSYRHALYLSGFRARANLTDPRIRCQQEQAVCTNDVYVIPAGVGGALDPPNGAYVDLFRIYVPPGTRNTYAVLFVPETPYQDIGVVARFGIPPTGDYSGLTLNDFPRTDTGYSLDELRKADQLAMRFGGHITIGSGFHAPLEEWEAGYLYVKIFYFIDTYLYQHCISTQVYVDPYINWYQKMDNNLFYGTADDWAYFGQQYTAPVPQITGPAVAYEGEPVSINVSLDPGSQAMQIADWWIVAESPFGWFSYVFPVGWFSGILPCVQTPLFDLTPSVEVLNGSLPAGVYKFYFALDNGADGVPDVTWLDGVQVTVLASTTTTTTSTTTTTTTTEPTTTTTTTLSGLEGLVRQ